MVVVVVLLFVVLVTVVAAKGFLSFCFFLFQIIDELLDVEKNPQKPQYTMASGEGYLVL